MKLTFPSLLVALVAFSLVAQAEPPADAKKPAAEPKKPNPVLEVVEEDPNLPRVLLIGDSISMGYTLPVREMLKGKANVQRVGMNGGPTIRGLQHLEEWLGDKPWDVIHFNFGLHDIAHVDRATGETSDKHQVPADEYEENLRTIVERLKKTGAVLIWCTTTPVPDGADRRVPGDEVTYNEIAARIMKENDILVDDLYTFVKAQPEIQLPRNVHFPKGGSQKLAEQVSASIREGLKVRAEKK